MKRCLTLVGLALIAFAAPARAAPFDMSIRTCQDWLDTDDDEQDQTIAWLRGYLSAKSGSTLYDVAATRIDGAALKRFCQGHPTVGIISAASQWGR